MTVAQVHNQITVRNSVPTRGLVKQQKSIDNSYYDQDQAGNEETNYLDSYKYTAHEENYLETQESVESYVEEETDDTITNGKLLSYPTQ